MSEQLQVPVPFVVFSLPRSRTAWLSRYLTYGPWVCGHEEVRYLRSMEDIQSWFMQPFIGSVESDAMFWWRLIERYAPGCRVLVVRRPVPDVVESLLRLGVGERGPHIMNLMRKMDAKLDQITARMPNVLSVEYDELQTEEGCKRLFEHCLLMHHDPAWWQYWIGVNVQVNVHARLRYATTYTKQIIRMRDLATYHVLADMHSRHEKAPYGALEIKEESFETSFPDAQKLFTDHCVEIGEPPDEWTRNNIPILAMMDKMGLLQIMTARANGQMFGYLVSMVGTKVGEEFEDKTATHTLFYASKEWPGAGMKLLRASLARLKERGVEEVYMRSGVGAGARIETVYKRMGAEYEGRLFKLRLVP